MNIAQMVQHREHSEYPSFLLKNNLFLCSKHLESDFGAKLFWVARI